MGALMVYDLIPRWDLDDFKLDLHIRLTAIDDIVISGINTTSVKSPKQRQLTVLVLLLLTFGK